MFSKSGVAEELGMSYDDIISQYADSMDSLFASDNLDETATFNAYYSGDDFAGFSFEKTARVQLFTPFLRTTLWLLILALT